MEGIKKTPSVEITPFWEKIAKIATCVLVTRTAVRPANREDGERNAVSGPKRKTREFTDRKGKVARVTLKTSLPLSFLFKLPGKSISRGGTERLIRNAAARRGYPKSEGGGKKFSEEKFGLPYGGG